MVLCSAVSAGFDLGFDRAGMQCAWQVEYDKNARSVLKKHWPDVPKYEDVRNVGRDNLSAVDVVCGGFPCQPHSLAGERKASDDERDLWGEFARIIREIGPRWVVAENVVGLLSSDDGRFFGSVLWDLAQSGYDAEWQVVSAAQFGAPHTRERVIIVAYPIGTGLSGRFFKDGIRRESRGTSTKFGNRDIACGGWWAENSANIRMGNGFPLQVARRVTKQAGNAVIPQLAEWIGRRIMALDGVSNHLDVGTDVEQLLRRNSADMDESVTVGTQDDAVINRKLSAQ